MRFFNAVVFCAGCAYDDAHKDNSAIDKYNFIEY